MSEVITVSFPDIMGDVSAYSVFLRDDAGTLLNTGGDTIAEIGASGIWSFTLSENRVANTPYLARIYSGPLEVAANLVYEDDLHPGQTRIGKNPDLSDKTVPFGTVGPGATTTSFTPTKLQPAGNNANQFRGRIIVFDNDTITPGLRGQATDITASSADALSVFTFTELTTVPSDGDTFKIS